MRMTIKAEVRRAMLYKDPNESAQASLPAFSSDSANQSHANI